VRALKGEHVHGLGKVLPVIRLFETLLFETLLVLSLD